MIKSYLNNCSVQIKKSTNKQIKHNKVLNRKGVLQYTWRFYMQMNIVYQHSSAKIII